MLKIIFETKDFIVIEKPYGFSTHSSPGDTAPDIVSLLAEEHTIAAAPITRLDRQTSGLLLLAKESIFTRNVLFQEKRYEALVFGLAKNKDTIEDKLTKKKFGSGVKVTQDAYTEYTCLETQGNASHLDIVITTGRNHQIRKHLAMSHLPIIGDYRYGFKDQNNALQEEYGHQLRLALHCARLVFSYQDIVYSYESALPKELQELWVWLSKRA